MNEFIVFVACVLFSVVAVMIAVQLGILELVSSKRVLLKTWSVWLGSLGATTGALIQSFPGATLQAWDVLPDDVKRMLPEHSLGIVSAFLIAMAVLAQFIRQKKLSSDHRQAEEK